MLFVQFLRTTVSCTLLTDWIAIRQLARLDSALCSTTIRPQYLALVTSASFVLNEIRLSHETYPLILWIIMRRIKAKNWFLTEVHTVTFTAPTLIRALIESTGGPHVRSLHISEAKKETVVILTAVASMCERITTASFVNCDDWSSLSTLSCAAQHSLRELSVWKCFRPLRQKGYNFAHNHFPNLVRLTLSGDYGAWATDSLLAAAPNLVHARFCCGAIDDSGLHTLSRTSAPNLQHLALISCRFASVEAVRNLADHCGSLKSLTLRVSHNTVAAEDIVPQFKGIEGLRIEKPVRAPPCEDCTAPCLLADTLRSLSLNGLQFVGPSGLQAVAQQCSLLQELELCDCPGIGSQRLVQVVTSMPLLRTLLLTGCTAVTDEVLFAIADNLPGLIMLSLYDAAGYTADGAIAIIKALRQLQHFDVSTDDTVFNAAVLFLWQEKAPGLQVHVDEWYILGAFPTS